jgi:HNH endonuclease
MITQRHETARRLYESGSTCREIAARLACSPATVARLMRELGIKPIAKGTRSKAVPNFARRKFDRALVAARYAEGFSSTKIAIEMGVTASAVLSALSACGIRIRDKHESNSLRARGTRGLSSHGYVRVNVDRRKRQYEHILIAERILRRRLRENERVHHINCDRADNRHTNLLICTHNYHLALHARMRAHPYWSKYERN